VFKLPRSRGNVNARLIESGNARCKQLPTEARAAEQLRMAARKALE